MFVPRCIKLAPSGVVKQSAAPTRVPSVPQSVESTKQGEEDEPIKVRCTEQRKAEQGEPICAVCGRYGEYICDETGDDLCSLECKKVILTYKELSLQQKIEWEPETTLSVEQAAEVRRSIDVTIQGESPVDPIVDFALCGLPTKLLQNLTSAGYETPTPIQMQVISAALKGRDILVSSKTGSGKTLSFLLPIVSKCCKIRTGNFADGNMPLAMVLTPTRELCSQVEEQAKILGKGLPFKTALVVGGDVMPQQVYRIRKGVELIVGTPGRLLDLLMRHEDIDLSNICMLVLDEVDCMLDKGFREQVMKIIRALTSPQIMLFSATIPEPIRTFAESITKSNMLVISAGQQPSKSVEQTVLWVETKQKKSKLFEILKSKHHFRPPSIVFVNSRMGAELLADAITRATGLRTAALHGQKPIKERREVLKSFVLGEISVLVATGVLGRGIDLLRVTQVIIYDMPNTVEEYTHQVGRASRMDQPGSAIVFINEESHTLFDRFVELLRGTGVVLPQALLKRVSYAPRKRKR